MSAVTRIYCDRCRAEIAAGEPNYRFVIHGKRESCEQPNRQFDDMCGCCAGKVTVAIAIPKAGGL